MFAHGSRNKKSNQSFVHEYIASFLADCYNYLCVYNASASLQKYLHQNYFSLLAVRLLLQSTLAVAETPLYAGELLPFGRRQP